MKLHIQSTYTYNIIMFIERIGSYMYYEDVICSIVHSY